MTTKTICSRCGSDNISQDAYLHVNTGEYSTLDDMTCGDCGYGGHYFTEVEVEDEGGTCSSAPSLREALEDLLGDIDGLAGDFDICREISESSYGKAARAALAAAQGG